MDILFIRNFDARNYTYWKDINKEQSCIKKILQLRNRRTLCLRVKTHASSGWKNRVKRSSSGLCSFLLHSRSVRLTSRWKVGWKCGWRKRLVGHSCRDWSFSMSRRRSGYVTELLSNLDFTISKTQINPCPEFRSEAKQTLSRMVSFVFRGICSPLLLSSRVYTLPGSFLLHLGRFFRRESRRKPWTFLLFRAILPRSFSIDDSTPKGSKESRTYSHLDPSHPSLITRLPVDDVPFLSPFPFRLSRMRNTSSAKKLTSLYPRPPSHFSFSHLPGNIASLCGGQIVRELLRNPSPTSSPGSRVGGPE